MFSLFNNNFKRDDKFHTKSLIILSVLLTISYLYWKASYQGKTAKVQMQFKYICKRINYGQLTTNIEQIGITYCSGLESFVDANANALKRCVVSNCVYFANIQKIQLRETKGSKRSQLISNRTALN